MISRYPSKRDFFATSERASTDAAESGNRFVIHKLSATADRYDPRLELDGVLKTWVAPK